MNTEWYGDGVRVVKDVSDDYFQVSGTYTDITLEAIAKFNNVA